MPQCYIGDDADSRTAAIEHVLRGDNQTADGPANGAMDKRLHTEEPLLQVVPTAVARFSSNFEVHSKTPLPAILASAPSCKPMSLRSAL